MIPEPIYGPGMPQEDTTFGETAVRLGLISPRQLEECRAIQTKLTEMGLEARPLAEILREKKYLSPNQIETVRNRLKSHPDRVSPNPTEPPPVPESSLAELAVQKGLISPDQLREALDLQEKIRSLGYEPKPVERILVMKGLLSEEQLRALRKIREDARRPETKKTRLVIPRRVAERLGEVAVRQKLIRQEQLMECLREQERARKAGERPPKIGELLVRRGYLTIRQLHGLVLAASKTSAPFEIPGYEILSKIGTGGMGAVYKATQLSVNRPVAIKILDPKFLSEREYLQRFLNEARILLKLQHPNIVAGLDAGSVDGTPYFVMEFVDGVTVATLQEQKGKLPEADCIRIGIYVAQALEHARKHGLVHRDIKPQNIMVTRDGLVKVCDLGIAKQLDAAQDLNLTQPGLAVGTPYYMSPEACMGQRVDIRSDIYSLGATLYFLSTGTHAFDSSSNIAIMTMQVNAPLQSPRLRNPALSEGFARAILRMMAKDPAKRYQTPQQVGRALEQLLHGQKGPPRLPGRPPEEPGVLRLRRPTLRSVARRRFPPGARGMMLILLFSALAAVLIGLVHAKSWPGRPPQDPSRRERRTTATSEPITSPAPAPVRRLPSKSGALEREHARRLRRLRELRTPGKANPTLEEVLQPYDFILESRARFEGTRFEDDWAKAAESFREEMDRRADDLWGRLREEVEALVTLGRIEQAIRRLENFPESLRYAGRNIPTRAERERRRLLGRLRRRVGTTVEEYGKEIDAAVQAGDFSEAWRKVLEASVAAGVSATSDHRRRVLQTQVKRLLGQPMTAQRYAGAVSALREIRNDYPEDPEFARAVDAAIERIRAARNDAFNTARRILSGKQGGEWIAALDALLKGRRYLSVARKIRDLLTDMTLAPLLQLPGIDAEDLIRALSAESFVPDQAESVRVKTLEALRVSAHEPSAGLFLRLWIAAELMTLWWEGFAALDANGRGTGRLEHPLLCAGRLLEVRRGDGPGLVARVRVAHGSLVLERSVPFFPSGDGALSEADLLRLLPENTRDLQLRAMLLYHAAGDARRAAEWAVKVPALPDILPVADLVERLRKPG